MSKDTRRYIPPRLVIELDDERKEALNKYIPWGSQKIVFTNIVDTLLEAFEVDEKTTLAGFYTGRLKIVVEKEVEE